MEEQNLIPFEGKEVRKIWHNEEWYFSIIDIIGVLTDSKNPRKYWTSMQNREKQLDTICIQLKMKASDGKNYKTDIANIEGIFRILMSVPSPKVEPLKLWLAEQGKRTIEEAENPELLTERQADLYRVKGYPEEWITRRVQTIETRKGLTDEWKKRGITEQQDYSILTAVIAKGTFGLTPSEHGKVKGLKRQNLRDHMTTFELIFAALGEETTRFNTEKAAAEGYSENYEVAAESGRMTGDALKGFEQRTGIKVVSSDNFLGLKGSDKPDELPSNDGKTK